MYRVVAAAWLALSSCSTISAGLRADETTQTPAQAAAAHAHSVVRVVIPLQNIDARVVALLLSGQLPRNVRMPRGMLVQRQIIIHSPVGVRYFQQAGTPGMWFGGWPFQTNAQGHLFHPTIGARGTGASRPFSPGVTLRTPWFSVTIPFVHETESAAE